jgi:Cu-processing system permease protein
MMSEHLRCLRLFAGQELVLAVRSKWTQIFAVVFTLLSLAVAWSGYILSGGSGVQDFARTSASLVQLVILLVPLASLVIGVLSLSPDRGAAELLFSQPVSRSVILAGEAAGVFLALVAAEAIGFGASGLVIFSRAGSEGLAEYLALFASAAILTAIFTAIAAWLGIGSIGRRRARGVALALVIWFAAVILFDVVALGVASLLPSGHASRLLIVSVIVNPVDAIRTGALLISQGTAAFGAASLAFLRFTHGATGAAIILGCSLLFWIALPIVAAMRKIERADL